MKNFKLYLILLLVAFFASCQKDNITVTLRTAGNLNVQLADSTGKKFQNVKVHLYSSYSTSSSSTYFSGEIDTKTTDSNGSVNFGTVESGTYYVVADTIKNGTLKYLVAKSVQVISGDSKNLVLNPMEFVGTIKLALYISTSGIDTLKRTSLKIALVNSNDYASNLNRSKVLAKAVVVKSFDAKGYVEFDNVPANINYVAYVYVNNTDTIGAWAGSPSYFSVSKGGIYSGSVNVNLSSLIIQKANLSLTLTYYSSASSTYKAVSAANVALIYYSDYFNNNLSTAPVSTVLQYAVKTGTTNSTGLVTFSNVPANVSYYAFVYYSTTRYAWDTNSMSPYPSGTNSYSYNNISGSSLGLTK